MSSVKPGLITPIPKSGKDKIILDNLRPSHCLMLIIVLFEAVADRLKKGPELVRQSGFLKGRTIHENIHTTYDSRKWVGLFYC